MSNDERPGWHRHPNGGGWVQDSAHVAPTAYVGPDARVYGTAQVYGSARVYGTARVYDSAQVYGSAWVRGSAQVYDSAQVGGTARVCGTALVEHTRHVVTVGPIGSEDRTVTAYRARDGHELVAGYWSGTVDELADRISHPKQEWPDSNKADRKRWKADYEAVIALVRSRLDEWSEWGDQS